MDRRTSPEFETPGFYRRLKGMLGVDFYRLFHTPNFYIILAISAIIPAMVLSMGGGGLEGQAPLANARSAAPEQSFTSTVMRRRRLLATNAARSSRRKFIHLKQIGTVS